MKKSVKRTVIALFLAGAIVSSLGATSVGALTIDNASMVDSAYDKPVVVKENKEITDADTLYYRAVNNINDVPVESIPLQDSDLKVTCDNGDIYTFKSYVTTQVLKETRTRSGEGEQLIAVTRVANTKQEPTSVLVKSPQSRSSQDRTEREENLSINTTVYYTKGVHISGEDSYLVTKVSGGINLTPAPLTGTITRANFTDVAFACQTLIPGVNTETRNQRKEYKLSGKSYSYNTGFTHPAIGSTTAYLAGSVTNAISFKPYGFGEKATTYELKNYVVFGTTT